MDGAVFSCCEIDHTVLSNGEVNAEAASVYKGHVSLFVALNAAEHVLLVRVGLALELHKLGELEALLHAPLDDAAVAGDRDERLALGLAVDPLDLPDDVGVLALQVLRLSDGFGVCRANIVDRDVSMGVTHGDQVRVFLGELTASD